MAVGHTTPAPFDLVIAAHMLREFSHGGQRMSKMANEYFYADIQCIQRRLPFFNVRMVLPQPGLSAHLTNLHKQALATSLGMVL